MRKQLLYSGLSAALALLMALTYAVPAGAVPAEEGESDRAPKACGAILEAAELDFDAPACESGETVACSVRYTLKEDRAAGDTLELTLPEEAAEAEAPTAFGFDYEAVVSYLVTECDHTVPKDYAEPQGRITITGLE